MSNEAWRAAVARWGDPIFGLALLLTGQRPAAERATVATFRRVYSAAPPTDPEIALYTALAQHDQPTRWRIGGRWSRRSALPRIVREIAPRDRLLLALWLLRGVSGAQLTAILGTPSAEIVTRLAALLRRITPAPAERAVDPADSTDAAAHLTLERWLEQQLGLTAAQSEHARICADCRVAQQRWQAALDDLRKPLADLARGQHLTQPAIDALEDALVASTDPAADVWWQQRRFWLPAFVSGVGLLLVALVVPWSDTREAVTTAPPTASLLVQRTLDAWTSPPADGTLHRRVLAINTTLRDPNPVVTDVWLAHDSPTHRVEVYRSDQLVEWQLAEGSGRFRYGGMPALNSCRWNTGYSGHFERFDDAALSFRISAEEQQTVRDARLRQGAYGTGYLLLRQALTAPDLRSFGTRVQDSTTLMVLSFTDDRVSPRQQVLLQIDPVTDQLYAAQQVIRIGGQSQVRDLWRLQTQDMPASGIPNTIPDWQPIKQLEQLVDPTCPALRPEYTVGLRQLGALPYDWYMPQPLPSGITSVALFSAQPQLNTGTAAIFAGFAALDTLYIGPDRWLSIAPAAPTRWQSTPTMIDSRPHERNGWYVQLQPPQVDQLWHGTLIQAQPATARAPQNLELWGAGWSQEELLAVVDALKPFDAQTWRELDHAFIDPQPLSTQARDTLIAALDATTRSSQQTAYTAINIAVRVERAPSLPADPFFMPYATRPPAQLTREHWLIGATSGQERLRDVWSLPDGTIYLAQIDDGVQLRHYSLPDGSQRIFGSSTMPLRLYTPDRQMLAAILSSSNPVSYAEQGSALLIEQPVPNLHQRHLHQLYNPQIGQNQTLDRTPDGDGVLRLWLDRATMLPQRLDIVHRSAQGQETPIGSIVVSERRLLDQAPDAALLTMPPLPDDTLTLQDEPVPLLAAPLSDTSWTSRSFTWPHDVGVSVTDERPPTLAWAQLSAAALTQNTWDSFNPALTWRQTRYQLDQSNQIITLTQGPSNMMRHVLRYSVQDADQHWTSSERLSTTIAGVPRDAWLLRNTTQSVLVVDLDDVLLHFAADEPVLRDFVVAHLPDLRRRVPSP